MNGLIRFNRKAWAAAITAPLSALVIATVHDGFGLDWPGLEEFTVSAVTALIVWAIPNDPKETSDAPLQ
ncbi:MAG: hypothetical protein ACE5JZ_03010 [Kiloniellales bacterium]